MKSKETRGIIILTITSVIWGLAFVAQRAGMDYVGSFTFNGVRFILGTLPLLPLIFIFERTEKDRERGRKTVAAGLAGGLILFSAASLQQFGIQLTLSVGKPAFITGLYIVLVPVMGIFMRHKITIYVWLGAVVACAGLYVLSVRDGFGSVEPGDILLFAGAVMWAAHIHLIGRFSGSVSPISFNAVQFAACGMLSLICAFITEDVSFSSILAGYIPILGSGLISVGIAYSLQIFGQRHVAPSKAAIIFSLESLFGALGGAFILGEIMQIPDYIGCALIFAGILVSQMRRRVTR